MERILFAFFVGIVSFWFWRLFLPYPWADTLGLIAGVLVLISTSRKKP